MKNRWIFLLLIAFVLPILAGCPAAPKTEEGLAIDVNKLPPPRDEVDVKLDLSGAKLVINDDTLAKMGDNGVPGDVVEALKSLSGQEFTNVADFVAAVKGAAGDGASPHMETIMLSSMVMELADEPAVPGAPPESAKADPNFAVIYFDFDKSDIRDDAESGIQGNADYLMANPDVKVTIEGHADSRGTNEYNLALGERRAQAVRQALIAKGVTPGQISTQSWGEERLASYGTDEDSHQLNRRTEFVTAE